jgi:hypothetical protein
MVIAVIAILIRLRTHQWLPLSLTLLREILHPPGNLLHSGPESPADQLQFVPLKNHKGGCCTTITWQL